MSYDWQPIDAAPKDRLIVLTDGGYLVAGFWQQPYGWMAGFSSDDIEVRIRLKPSWWCEIPLGPEGARL